MTFIVRDSELRNFCCHLMEEIPKVFSFMYDYVEKTEGLKKERPDRGVSNHKTENPTIDSSDNKKMRDSYPYKYYITN